MSDCAQWNMFDIVCDSDRCTHPPANILNVDSEPSPAWEGTHLLSVLVFHRIGMFSVLLLHHVRLCTMEHVSVLHVQNPSSFFMLMITFL